MTTGDRSFLQPVLAGVVAALVGFASSFTVVLAGLAAVGASADQAASGLFALCIGMGLLGVVLGLRLRMPISIAWSTPGAALLVSAGAVSGGYPAALGAFLVVGVLIVLAGLWSALGRAIAAIPVPIAAAMLAGVLLPLCLAPVRAVADIPMQAAPVVLAWALLMRFARRWAVPGALVVAVAIIAATEDVALGGSIVPPVELTLPAFDAAALASLAIPLFVVTMASQNVPGMSVLAVYGYRPPLRPLLVSTGAVTAATAPFGAHAVNLAAITAALAASPDAHPDPARRWIASVSGGAFYLLLGAAAGLAGALVAAAPPILVQAVAGLALLGALASALAAALADEGRREAAVVCFVVSASGIAPFAVSAPFWGLLAGLAYLRLLSTRPAATAPPAPS